MTDRVSRGDVIRAFGAHIDVLQQHGLIRDGDTWHLQIGNQFQGWALYVTTGDSLGEHAPNIGADRLGDTAREARSQLINRTRVLYDTFAELRAQGRWHEPRRETTHERIVANLQSSAGGAS